MAALGLHAVCGLSLAGEWGYCGCGAQASHCRGFSSSGSRAPGCAASVIPARGRGSCGTWADLRHSMRDPPGPGIEAVSPVLEGGFFTTEPPGKPEHCLNCGYCWLSFAKKLSASVLGPFICEDLIGFIV